METHGNFNNVLSHLPEPKMNPALPGMVFARLSLESARRAKERLIAACILAFAFSVSFGVAVVMAVHEFLESNFYSYLSLAFSDSDSLMVAWKEFGLSLLESMPLVGITLSALALFGILATIRFAVKSRGLRVRFA